MPTGFECTMRFVLFVGERGREGGRAEEAEKVDKERMKVKKEEREEVRFRGKDRGMRGEGRQQGRKDDDLCFCKKGV